MYIEEGVDKLRAVKKEQKKRKNSVCVVGL